MAEVPFLPPGPSEEFLRRQAMYAPQLGTATAGSFDPATGERQSQTFDVPVTPPATSEIQMMEAIRQQINAMHFKNANDALNAAIRFQHMRAAQRMRESGATEEQIWGSLGLGMVYNNPNAYVSRMGQLTPTPDPYLTNYGGRDFVVHGKNKAVTQVREPSSGETIETGVDATGQPFSRITRGGKAAGGLTVATQGQVQQRLIGFEKSIGTAAELHSKLTPEMLGVKGLLGDIVVDRGLAQISPELANTKRINGRTLLRVFNEQIIKSLKVDAQVNRDEERRLLAALPDAGAVSSLPEAQEKIRTFMGLIRDQARVDAQKSGVPIPNWALSLDDIARKVKAKQMSEAEAIALMERYGIRQ